MQSNVRTIERRGGRREAAAFSARFQRDGGESWSGAWVVDLSPRGAAFLTMNDDVPNVGDELQLGDFPPEARGASDARPPQRARVTRIDDLPGLTRKIVVTFEHAGKR